MHDLPAPIRRFESRFASADGASLFRRGWLPPDPHAVLLLVHGFAEHSGRYEGFGSWFAARGFAVIAFDHRGHGRSAGRRNYVRQFDDFLDDVAAFETLVQVEFPGLPRILVGHSMGGLISASYALERNPQLSGLALSGPMLLPPDVSSFQRMLIRVLRVLAPKRTMSTGLDPAALSRDPHVGRRYMEDPLVDTRVTIALAATMMSAAARLHGRGAEIRMPLLLMHGAADPLCRAAGSQAFFADRAGPVPAAGGECAEEVWSRLHLYPELRHEIFNEPERETVFENLLDWLSCLEALRSTGAAERDFAQRSAPGPLHQNP